MVKKIQPLLEESPKDMDRKGLIEELFKTYYSPLVKLVYRMLKNVEVSEDIVQDVFIKVWNNRQNLDETKSIKSYLYRSAINTTLNHIEKNKRSVQVTKIDSNLVSYSGNQTEEKVNFKELEKKVSAAIDTLPPKCKVIFVMSRYDELSYKEIADTLELSVKTVENQIGKALSIMREQLKGSL
ncbi:MAG TPA: RNA polymerase sigma-70 factor [Cytophagales bacterium]|nr:RNA polymerase sigma-70 factor [Cytophagales bacterium]